MDEMVLEKQATKTQPGLHGCRYRDEAGHEVEIRAVDELFRLIVNETERCEATPEMKAAELKMLDELGRDLARIYNREKLARIAAENGKKNKDE